MLESLQVLKLISIVSVLALKLGNILLNLSELVLFSSDVLASVITVSLQIVDLSKGLTDIIFKCSDLGSHGDALFSLRIILLVKSIDLLAILVVPVSNLRKVFFKLFLLILKASVQILLTGQISLQSADFNISIANLLFLLINFRVKSSVSLISLSKAKLSVIDLSANG